MTSVIASDLHLGSRNCQAALFARFLRAPFDQLILNGDILNSVNLKKLGGVLEFVKRRSVHYARNLGCHGVITAHTHFSEDEWIDDVHYLNTGCWVDRPCTYVVAENDRPRLCHWDEADSVAKERTRL